MTDLKQRLDVLGLIQYFDAFASEGFDTWDTLLDITESDLEHLNVKLGHRRKLQRAIAEARGITTDKALPISLRRSSLDTSYRSDDSGVDSKDASKTTPASTVVNSTGTKRKYRRHPKPDDNAPERPASAYVIFSNQVREELRGQEMSFTIIAKIVGERWQVLDPEIRDAVERQAATAKEKYYAELAEYKKTPEYAQYQEYLAEFKAKHGAPQRGGSTAAPANPVAQGSSAIEGKRTKLETQTSTSTRSSSQGEAYDRLDRNPAHAASDALYQLARSGSSPPNSAPHATYAHARVPSQYSGSPAIYAQNLQSPSAREPYSPTSTTSPASVAGHPAFDLPHHARHAQVVEAARGRSDVPSPSYSSAYHPPSGGWTSGEQTPVRSNFSQRRTATPTSLPALLHGDTSASSDGGLMIPPLSSITTSLLPALDAPKSERMLPQPVPTAISSLLASPVVTLPRPAAVIPAVAVAGVPAPMSMAGDGQWPALLRATELAREVDLPVTSATAPSSTELRRNP